MSATPREDDAAAWLGLGERDGERLARFAIALLDKKQDAHAVARIAVELVPRSALAWLALGAAAGRLGNEAEALVGYQQATALDPTLLRAWVDLAELYVARLEYPRAAEALEKARALDPEGKTQAGKRAQALVVSTLLTLDPDA